MIGDLLAKLARKQDLTPGEIEELRLAGNSLKASSDLVSGWSSLGFDSPAFKFVRIEQAEFGIQPNVFAALRSTTGQSIATSTATDLTFNEIKRQTGTKMFDLTVSTSRLYPEVPGYYYCWGYVTLAANATGVRFIGVHHVSPTADTAIGEISTLPNGVIVDNIGFNGGHWFDIGDYLKVTLWQNSGGPLTAGTHQLFCMKIE